MNTVRKMTAATMLLAGCLASANANDVNGDQWHWKSSTPSSWKDGTWVPGGIACHTNNQNPCAGRGEFEWFRASRGGTNHTCITGSKVYCNSIGSLIESYVYLGKAPACPKTESQAGCPQGWKILSKDSYGDGLQKCQNGHIYLCVKEKF